MFFWIVQKFALIIGSGDMLSVEAYGGEAQYLLSYEGDQVRIEIGGGEDGEGGSENESKLEPLGVSIRLEKPTRDGFITFRIVKPSNKDENPDEF